MKSRGNAERHYSRRTAERRRELGRKLVRNLSLILIVLLLADAAGVYLEYTGRDFWRNGRKADAGRDVVQTNGEVRAGSPGKSESKQGTAEAEKKVTLMAVGDNLIHQAVWDGGKQDDGSFDHRVLYEHILPYLESTDLKIINQETIIGGDERGFQDFPLFNTPEAIGDTVAEVGFNVVLQASNHAWDQGLDGLLHAAQYWKTKHPEITMVGIYETEEEQKEIPVVEMNGIRIAILNYTYSHNTETFSAQAEGHLNMLCDYDESSRYIDFNTIHPQVLEDIRRAEEQADFTIVCPHWGTEYMQEASEQQIRFAEQMTEAGADLIIGTHPHVCQPAQWVEADNGNRAFCYYSLGNFISAQDGVPQMLGGMASLTILQDETGTHIDPESVKAIPLVTHFIYPGWNGTSVTETTYLLDEYTEELAQEHGLRNAWGITITKAELEQIAQDTFGEYLSMR